jgi:hypothetical protein
VTSFTRLAMIFTLVSCDTAAVLIVIVKRSARISSFGQ